MFPFSLIYNVVVFTLFKLNFYISISRSRVCLPKWRVGVQSPRCQWEPVYRKPISWIPTSTTTCQGFKTTPDSKSGTIAVVVSCCCLYNLIVSMTILFTIKASMKSVVANRFLSLFQYLTLSFLKATNTIINLYTTRCCHGYLHFKLFWVSMVVVIPCESVSGGGPPCKQKRDI